MISQRGHHRSESEIPLLFALCSVLQFCFNDTCPSLRPPMPLPEDESESEQGGRLDDQQYENEVRKEMGRRSYRVTCNFQHTFYASSSNISDFLYRFQ